MTPEPLIPLVRAIALEAARLEISVTVTVDMRGGTIAVEGEALLNWGCRTQLEATLTRHRIRHDTYIPSARIVVYPAGSDPSIRE